MHSLRFTASAIGALAASVAAHGAVVTGSNFDQIAQINALGGTVTQVGGTTPGALLANAGGFGGGVGTSTGVAVGLPGFRYVDRALNLVDVGGSEPGNIQSLLEGSPTDLTFTTPGAGGPDGTIGDGSIHFTQGDSVDLFFDFFPVTAGFGFTDDVFIFTNTNGGGVVNLTFSLLGAPVDGINLLLVPGGGAGSGIGGVLLDLPDGLVYDQISVFTVGSDVEIDAVGVRGFIPTPGAASFLALAAVAAGRRRR